MPIYRLFLILLGGLVGGGISSISAEKIENFGVELSGEEFVFKWTPPSPEVVTTLEGYALQWSSSKSDIHHDEPSSQLLPLDSTTNRKMNFTFDEDTTYYFRVYGYQRVNNDRVLSHGSAVVSLVWDRFGRFETDSYEAEDTEATDTSIDYSQLYTQDASFGKIRVVAYDKFADISWPDPSLTLYSGYYDDYELAFYDDPSLSNKLFFLRPGNKIQKIRLVRLTPETSYYVQGHYLKDKEYFGAGENTYFTTLAEIDRSGMTRSSRNIMRVLNREDIPAFDTSGSRVDLKTIVAEAAAEKLAALKESGEANPPSNQSATSNGNRKKIVPPPPFAFNPASTTPEVSTASAPVIPAEVTAAPPIAIESAPTETSLESLQQKLAQIEQMLEQLRQQIENWGE